MAPLRKDTQETQARCHTPVRSHMLVLNANNPFQLQLAVFVSETPRYKFRRCSSCNKPMENTLKTKWQIGATKGGTSWCSGAWDAI